MGKGGISPSGRALRYIVWRLPLGMTKFSIARNVAVLTEEGRRWLALAGFGLWVGVFWWAASLLHDWLGLLVPLQLAAFFGVLLIWRIVGNLRRLWAHRRNLTSMARNAQIQREMYQVLTALPGQIQTLARSVPVPGGTFTMRGSMRHHDPAADQEAALARQQAEQARSWLPPEHADMPLGDRFEPIFRLP
ncbi:MAG TPA: hypothetical protein VJ966_03455, partial [Actinomycetes bacterium]|nr:hypothetical protein [Actinomycetes bacterium]